MEFAGGCQWWWLSKVMVARSGMTEGALVFITGSGCKVVAIGPMVGVKGGGW